MLAVIFTAFLTDAASATSEDESILRRLPTPSLANHRSLQSAVCPTGFAKVQWIELEETETTDCGLLSCDDPKRLHPVDMDECLALCLSDKRCRSFSWSEIGEDGKYPDSAVCTIFGELTPANPMDDSYRIFCSVSGPRKDAVQAYVHRLLSQYGDDGDDDMSTADPTFEPTMEPTVEPTTSKQRHQEYFDRVFSEFHAKSKQNKKKNKEHFDHFFSQFNGDSDGNDVSGHFDSVFGQYAVRSPTGEPTMEPTSVPTMDYDGGRRLLQSAKCPLGSLQIDSTADSGPSALVAGCGMLECKDPNRFSQTDIDECHLLCKRTTDCRSFAWYEVGAHQTYGDSTVCDLYEENAPIPSGPNDDQTLCALEADTMDSTTEPTVSPTSTPRADGQWPRVDTPNDPDISASMTPSNLQSANDSEAQSATGSLFDSAAFWRSRLAIYIYIGVAALLCAAILLVFVAAYCSQRRRRRKWAESVFGADVPETNAADTLNGVQRKDTDNFIVTEVAVEVDESSMDLEESNSLR